MHRRTFLQTVAGSIAAAAAPPSVTGIKLGFDSYSIRNLKWKALQLIEYAGSLKLDAIQLSSLGDFESLEPAYLEKVKEAAKRHGLQIDTGVGCICPSSASYKKSDGTPEEYIARGLKATQILGSKVMRCYMGSSVDRKGPVPIEAHMENTIKVFKSVRQMAGDMGIRIGLENHSGDMQAREVKIVIEESGRDPIGANLDTGNPMWVVEDPMVTLEVLAPYVVTTHIRDSAVWEHPRGAAAQWVALGDGCIDFPKFVSRFRELCPNSAMHLEIITGRPPQVLNYLEPDFWKVFPKASAAEFSRFVALAKNGHPFMGTMVVGGTGKQPPALDAALTEQQKTDLESSLEYAKKSLGLGIRWRR